MHVVAEVEVMVEEETRVAEEGCLARVVEESEEV